MDRILFLLIGIILGVLVGVIIGWNNQIKHQSSGYLRWDHSDPDSPYMFIEVKDEATLNTIPTKKTVLLEVIRKDFLPRK